MDERLDVRQSNDIVSIENLRENMNRHLIRGVPLLFGLVLFFPIFAVLPSNITDVITIPLLVGCALISMVGAYFLVLSSNWKSYIYCISILQRIGSPEPVITEEYAVAQRDGTYLFVLQSVPEALYCVAFKIIHETLTETIDVPKLFLRWHSTVEIDGLKAHDKIGQFSAPTPERTIISGEGILLAVPLLGRAYLIHVPEFSKQQILSVADYASLLMHRSEKV